MSEWNFRVLDQSGNTVATHKAVGVVVDGQGIKLMGPPSQPGGDFMVIATYSPATHIVVGGRGTFGDLQPA